MITNLISNFVSPSFASPYFVGGVTEAPQPQRATYSFFAEEYSPKTQEQGQSCFAEEYSPKTQEQCQSRGPKHCSRTSVNDGDVLLTIARDLRNIREGIINRCTRRETLFHVDTLIDNLENYMAEN